MILTVTLNAAIDRTVAVPSFRQGHRHRAVEASTVAGGKGVNVARALKILERPVIATGLAGGPTGARLMERLAEESILTDFTWISGESRTNLAVIDPTTGEQTEINERGPDVTAGELERFLEKLLYLARGARICAIAGSMPPSVPASFSARMVEELKALGVETIVDTEGEPLISSLRAEPAAVTPNVREAEGAVGHEFNDREDLLSGLLSLVELGAGDAVITRPEGCVASLLVGEERDERRAYEVTAPSLEPIATVGSGDAFLAGYVAGRYDGRSPEECLRFAVACGAESTQHFGAGSIDSAEVERLLQGVEANELDARRAAV
jgi:1-phosphofructokinase family hexose kinase